MSGGIVCGAISAVMASSIDFVGASAILFIVYWALYICGSFDIYEKFGESGWKSIIPLYNSWIEYKHTWNPFVAILIWALCVVSGVMLGAVMTSMVFGVVNPPLAIVAMILGLAGWIIGIVGNYKLARAFGHGGRFTVGLVLLPGIFRIILGFGKSQYVGKVG